MKPMRENHWLPEVFQSRGVAVSGSDRFLVKLFLAAACAAPLAAQCVYQVTTTDPTSISAAANNVGTMRVAAPNNCAWTAASDSSWLKITFGQAGSGNGSVGWSADRSPSPNPRTGRLNIAGQVFTITQAAQNCSYTAVGDTSAALPVAGGRGVFQIKTNCTWLASASVPWITVSGGGDVDGTINYTVAANACVADRSGFVSAGDLRFPIAQSGSAANLTISPTTASAPFAGAAGSFNVTTGAGCAWSATVSADWLTLVSASGTGTGSLSYRVAANTGVLRTGVIRVPPQAFTVTQEGIAAPPPTTRITAVVNAASYAPPPVAPGEIVTIYGIAIGPAALVRPQLTPDGRALTKSLGSTRVLFDDVAAAMIYASDGQTSAVVPYSVDTRIPSSVVVEYNGIRSPAFPLPVASSSPAIFTLDQSGKNAGAILNQDSTVNGADNPAARGSVIQIYCTGAGVTLPASLDAQLTGLPLPWLTLPVGVTIGGADAKVWYSGGAPDAVAGLTQINAEVPLGILPGNAVPLRIRIGDRDTQDGVTVSVR